MVVSRADVELLTDQALDHAEILQYWYQRDVTTFGIGLGGDKKCCNSVESANTGSQAPANIRRKAHEVMRHLLFWHEALEELPVALTIFDALEQKVQGTPSVLAQNGVSDPTTFAALTRIVLKCGGSATRSEDELSDDVLAKELANIGEENVSPELITQTETNILSVLEGRVVLSSPLQWADKVITRLTALVALGLPMDCSVQIPESTVTGVHAWAWYLSENISATADLPPWVLGLTACVLGLISARVLSSEEILPQNMSDSNWAASLLAQVGVVNDEFSGAAEMAQPLLQVETLAEAACCTEEELRSWVFAGVTSLQASFSD